MEVFTKTGKLFLTEEYCPVKGGDFGPVSCIRSGVKDYTKYNKNN